MRRIYALQLSVIFYDFIMAEPHSEPLTWRRNVECGLYTDTVPTDISFRYIPYYVNLNRCQGKDFDLIPKRKECIPTVSEPVQYLMQRRSDGRLENITLFNHTSCTYKCTQNASWCRNSSTWNEDICSCCNQESDCDRGHEWSHSDCQCVLTMEPPVIPANQPEPEQCLELKYVILLIVCEFFVVVMIFSAVMCVFAVLLFYNNSAAQKIRRKLTLASLHESEPYWGWDDNRPGIINANKNEIVLVKLNAGGVLAEKEVDRSIDSLF